MIINYSKLFNLDFKEFNIEIKIWKTEILKIKGTNFIKVLI